MTDKTREVQQQNDINMCLYPRLIKNPKYKANKKNGGIIPAVADGRALYVPIGCQKCMECRKQKAREWQLRLMEDIKTNNTGRFITLTFSNESIRELHNDIPFDKTITRWKDGVQTQKEVKIDGYDRDNAIAILAVRRFLERWRKRYGKSIRHWLVTELGHNGTENIHMHGIVWQPKEFTGSWVDFMTEVEHVWQYGYVWKWKMVKEQKTNYVNEATINYTTKYVNKADLDHTAYKSQILTSAGIGSNYTKNGGGNWTRNKYKGKETDEAYRTRTGQKMAMPIYWRNKIYTEEEREKLWLQKLDKNERWVCGERIDVSKSDKEYYKVLDFYRKKNARLGYGDDKLNWSRAKYEQQRRGLMLSKRLGYPVEWDRASARLLAAGQ